LVDFDGTAETLPTTTITDTMTTELRAETKVDNNDCGDFDVVESLPTTTDTTVATPLRAETNVDDDFGDFDEAEPSPTTDIRAETNVDDDFGDFDVAEPSPTTDIRAETNVDDDFGDFDVAEPSPTTDIRAETNVDDDFGDFDEAEPSPTTDIRAETNVDDDFGDFDVAEPLPTTDTTTTQLRAENHVDHDEFGDFGAAEPLPTTATTTVHPDTLDDDDDFGDFDEAPASGPSEGNVTIDQYETTKDIDPVNVSTDVTGSGDPIMEKLNIVFPKLFSRFVSEENSILLNQSCMDASIPAFTESDFVSIESIMVRHILV
jgi:rubredoxin